MRRRNPREQYLRYLIACGSAKEWLKFLLSGALKWSWRIFVCAVIFVNLAPYLGIATYATIKLFMAYGWVVFAGMALLKHAGVYTPPLWWELFEISTKPIRWIDSGVEWLIKS